VARGKGGKRVATILDGASPNSEGGGGGRRVSDVRRRNGNRDGYGKRGAYAERERERTRGQMVEGVGSGGKGGGGAE